MRLTPASAVFAYALGVISISFLSPRPALAFGGSADDLGQAGNFVVSNRANLGFTQPLTNPSTTELLLAPELDYFVAPHVAVGGAIVLDITTPHGATGLGVVPQVAYDVVLSGTWSFLPRLALTMMTGAPATFVIEASAPFLVHPVEHFFVGFGPAIESDLNERNLPTTLFGEFLVGGYFSG